MFTYRIMDDEAFYFAVAWGEALAYDFQVDWKNRHNRKISLFRIVSEYKGYEYLMAKRSNNASESNTRKQLVWLNVAITDDMVEKAQTASNDAGDLLGTVGALVLLGYGFSVKPSGDGKSVMATLLRDAEDDNSQPLGLSAFAPSVHGAIALLLCKFYDGLDGQWLSPQGDNRPIWR